MRYLFVIFCCIAIGHAKAQTYSADLVLDSYKHSITFGDHTLVFQLQASDQVPEMINTQRKYYWYSNNQIKITQGGYSGKLLHGSYNEFYFNKNLKEQGRFEMGLKAGEWNSWNVQGILIEKTNFEKGVPHGNFYKYNGLGEVFEAGKYKNGSLDGKLTKYFGKDSTVVNSYKKGLLQIPKPNWFKRLLKKKPKTELTPK